MSYLGGPNYEKQPSVYEGECDACVLIDGDCTSKLVQWCK